MEIILFTGVGIVLYLLCDRLLNMLEKMHGKPLPGEEDMMSFQGKNGMLMKSPWEFVPAGESGKIFGSVNTIQLAEAMAKKGFEIDRKKITIKEERLSKA